MLSFLFYFFSFIFFFICITGLVVLLYCLIQDVCISNTKPKKGMTLKKKKLKQTLMDHYLYEKKGYKSD